MNKNIEYTKGKPAYSPCMLTRLVIMASVDEIFSSRKIMKLAEKKMVCIWNGQPNFWTIWMFNLHCKTEFVK